MSENNGYLPLPKGFATKAIHVGQDPDQWSSMSVVPPIVNSTTFKQFGPAEFKQYEYGRSGNPSRDVLQRCLAALENAKYALCFSSGLGASSALLGMFNSGDHILCCDDVYGGTNRLLSKIATRFGIEITFVDPTILENVENGIKSNTKLVWIESPTNPLLKVIDIKAVSEITKKHNVLLLVDNTFLTSYFQRPLELGANLSLHSLTKYMNGHSDVIMGAILTNDDEIYQKLKFLQNAMGIVPAPYDCAQVNRSLKTLALRMQQHSKNALKVAEFLESHPNVEKVMHPGLKSHPQHELFKRQTSGHSGMVSVYIKGDLEDSKRFLKCVKVFTLAESLGGYESLIELPSVMTHASVPEAQRKALKITDNLIRLSVGLEDIEDIIADLKQALDSYRK